jgi:hypothetical protein
MASSINGRCVVQKNLKHKVVPAALILFASLLISACSAPAEPEEIAQPEPTPSYSEPSPLTELVGTYMSEWSSCFDGFQSETLTCSIGYTIKNPTDAPIELMYAEVYAQVDGKIFKAASDQGSDGVSTLSQTWNPGEELKGATYFNVPEGSIIESIFFADDPSLSDADLIFEVNHPVVSE